MLTTSTETLPNARLSPRKRPSPYIMLIVSETALAETLQLALNEQGYQVSVLHDGLRGLLAIQRVVPDLVIVDWSPPRISGLEICDRLRQSWNAVPIILLTRGQAAKARIQGLRAGASDCLSWPFVTEELVARIQARLAHYREQREVSILRCADLQLNRKTREVFRGFVKNASVENYPIHLTAKEFDLLEYLMSHQYQVLTRTQILDRIWGYSYTGSSNIIEVYIRYLRKKLEADNGKRLIHTIRGVGYILKEREDYQDTCRT